MPLPILGIAKGAFTVGKMLLEKYKAGVGKKKDRLMEKQASQLGKVERRESTVASLENQFKAMGVSSGATAISSSGNLLAVAQQSKAQDQGDGDEAEYSNTGNVIARKVGKGILSSPAGIVGILAFLYVVLKALKIIR